MALVKPLVRQSLRLSPIVPAPRRVIRTSSPRPWKVGWAATLRNWREVTARAMLAPGSAHPRRGVLLRPLPAAPCRVGWAAILRSPLVRYSAWLSPGVAWRA